MADRSAAGGAAVHAHEPHEGLALERALLRADHVGREEAPEGDRVTWGYGLGW